MIDGLLSLAFAGIAFCGSHVLLSSTALRGSLRDQLGEHGFLAVYSLTALVTFAWFLVAYAHAPTIFLWRITEPVLRPIRRVLPDLGGIDVSPVVLILILWFVRDLMFEYLV